MKVTAEGQQVGGQQRNDTNNSIVTAILHGNAYTGQLFMLVSISVSVKSIFEPADLTTVHQLLLYLPLAAACAIFLNGVCYFIQPSVTGVTKRCLMLIAMTLLCRATGRACRPHKARRSAEANRRTDGHTQIYEAGRKSQQRKCPRRNKAYASTRSSTSSSAAQYCIGSPKMAVEAGKKARSTPIAQNPA